MNKKIFGIFASIEYHIHELQTELQLKRKRKALLEEQVQLYLSTLWPDAYKEMLALKPFWPKVAEKRDHTLLKINYTEDILAYSVKNLRFSFDADKDEGLFKNWSVEGQIGSFSFIIELLSLLDDIYDKHEPVYVKKVELFPQSETLEEFALNLKKWNFIKPLVPNLCTYEYLVKERSLIEDYFNSYIEIETNYEEESLIMKVQLDNSVVNITWKIVYSIKNFNFVNEISVYGDSEAMGALKNHSHYDVLNGDRMLTDSEEVYKFIINLFKE